MEETIEKYNKVIEIAKKLDSMDIPMGVDITFDIDHCDPDFIRQLAKHNFHEVGQRNEGKIFYKNFHSYCIRVNLWE